ncbi:hypothetical protein AAY473_027221 [Plecturocebus cupreus]
MIFTCKVDGSGSCSVLQGGMCSDMITTDCNLNLLGSDEEVEGHMVDLPKIKWLKCVMNDVKNCNTGERSKMADH